MPEGSIKMERIFGLIKKEFIHFYRDPVAMALIVYHFTACVVLCAYCWIVDAKHLKTVIYDMNRTAISRDLIENFVSNEYFDLEHFATSMEEVKKYLDSFDARVALIIPPDFSRNLTDGRPAPIQFICDGSDANQAGQAVGFAKRIIGSYNEKILVERLGNRGLTIQRLPGVDNLLRTLYNQEMEGVYYVVLYHIVVAGLIGGLVLSGTAIVREKERGTIDQLLVTPTRTWEILIAKTIGPLLIGLFATVFSFLVMFWFQVPSRGNPFNFIALMGLFLIGTTGIGICVGTICQNMLQTILMSFGVWFGGIFLSGIVTPLENMMPFLTAVGKVLPTTHFNVASNAVIQKGLGWSVLWPEALWLISIGVGLLSLGCLVTRRQFKQ